MATTVREKNYTPLEHPPQIVALTISVSALHQMIWCDSTATAKSLFDNLLR
ncbi:hypothetical protein [Neomesorhizobium albiziae]|uniref:hypothetical protein n=1 Tax=Neomesorhizobium albiziae TaxID=335020 RepID=UPI00165ED761|nr:hypothetical protein [Mesorhizobium albiziae]